MGFKVESKNWIEVVKEDIGHKTCRNNIYVIKIKKLGKVQMFSYLYFCTVFVLMVLYIYW